MEIALRHGPVNWGDIRQGSCFSREAADILEGISDESVVHAVFTDEGSLSVCLDELRREDLGLSVVVSGLLGDVRRSAARAGLEPHTVAWSMGAWGRTDRLPASEVLNVTTMCGHGLVSASLVRAVAKLFHEGRLTSEEAGERLSRPCVCGIFNPARAVRCLRRMTSGAKGDDRH
ncbi:MAG: hypothetical protein A2Y56_12640 [Candidatus Aminicenantes bacterium RBG_13_63_10]|nr:MAG: hypothetical protein A2Y56_12640 [Candidatus Aminicenantes bacterium RBG_13_63_10]